MQEFTKTITVTKNDLDELNHVNNVRYVQWVQDIAEAHWLSKVSDDILEHYFWVLVSHHIEYKSQAVLGDTLQLKTYVSKSEGVTSIRHVEIINIKDNKLMVTSETKWCFMNTKTKRPARISTEIAELFD
ncbi:acyl-CoA thioesterase [Winogradskyella ursingii]|uniref:acyl-CoA thioesterase n=1 Tax=Winogradskyella ursingii TaxID=2686079 RepID=UPI0015CC4124|nr:thioesterase family protein [Winogradskyella ursingii]